MARISLTKSFPPTTTSVLDITEASRTPSQTTFNLTFTTNLASSQSYTYASYVATVTISGDGITTQTQNYTLKESGSLWSGTATHTTTTTQTFNIPGDVSLLTVSVLYKYSDESTTMSGSTTMNLTRLVSILGAVGTFNDVDSKTLSITKYSNAYTHELNVYKRNSDNTIDTNVIYATRSNVEDGYVFSFTQQELNYLYNQNTTTKFVSAMFVLTTYSGETTLGDSQQQAAIVISNAQPIFTDFDISDVNNATIALTGDNSKLIKGYSTMEALITVANKATAVKGATMVSYSSSGVIEDYSSSEDVSILIPNYANDTIEVSAIDSRLNSTTVSKNVDLLAYEDIAITNTPSIARQSNTGEATTLNIRGTFWNDDFGSVTNGLTVTYKYKVSGSSDPYTTGTTTITPTISGNTFSIINQAILGDTNAGFDSQKSYEIVVTIFDELSSYEIIMTLQAGVPAFAVYGNKMAIGDAYNTRTGGTQLWGDVYLNGQLLQPQQQETESYAQMHTDGRQTVSSTEAYVTSWTSSYKVEVGDFECDLLSDAIKIPAGSAEVVEIGGGLSGGGYAIGRLRLVDANGTLYSGYVSSSAAVLIQTAGNKYFQTALPTTIINIDTTKDWYLKLQIAGYNDSFTMNDGFSTSATYIYAKKMK